MENKIPNSISKKTLWHYVNKKINRSIHHSHVLSVISILFEEILEDFKSGKPIDVLNFGKIELKYMKPRTYFNVIHQKLMVSSGRKILRFKLPTSLKKKICKYIDTEKTFLDTDV